MPAGLEFYEIPESGHVVLRKRIAPQVRRAEVQQVKTALRQVAAAEDLLLDVKGEVLTVYTGNVDPARFQAMFPERSIRERRALLAPVQHYTPQLRFILTDTNARTFTAQRLTIRHDEDHWVDVATGQLLEVLAERVCHHWDRVLARDLDP